MVDVGWDCARPGRIGIAGAIQVMITQADEWDKILLFSASEFTELRLTRLVLAPQRRANTL